MVWMVEVGRTSEEVVCLALHGADAALLWVGVLAKVIRVRLQKPYYTMRTSGVRCLSDDTGKHTFSVGLQTYHPDEPLDSLPVLVTVVGERDLVVLIVLLAEVQLHAGTFEDTLRLAGCLVDDRWDTSIGC